MPNYTQQPPVNLIGDASVIVRSLGDTNIEIEIEDATGARAKVTASPGQADQIVIAINASKANSAQP